MTHPDAELLLRLAAGEVEVFEVIVDRFERPLLRYFHALCNDAQLAEDCAQEVFVRLYKARERYTVDAAPTTFVFRIARNLWIDVVRARRSRPDLAKTDTVGTGDDEVDRTALLESSTPAPADAVGHAEDQRRLQEAMQKLSEGQRAVLALAVGQSMKYELIAEILGIPIGTVKSRVHAAVASLRKLLGVEEAS
jgi:RNA polymerase sigma-70 factor, ECF subfamily